MTRGSELMLYVLFGIPVVLIGFVFLVLGPLGWFLAAFLGVAVIGAVAMLRGDEEGSDGPDRVNCPACGSRTAGDACEYCGEAL